MSQGLAKTTRAPKAAPGRGKSDASRAATQMKREIAGQSWRDQVRSIQPERPLQRTAGSHPVVADEGSSKKRALQRKPNPRGTSVQKKTRRR